MSNAFPVARRRWAPKRFWASIGLVFAVQVGLIFGLSDRSLPAVRKSAIAPVLHLAPSASVGELQTLEDPTRFVLPHREGFSGTAWLKVPRLEFHPEPRPEPLRWLPVPTQEIGVEFSRYVRTNASPALQTLAMFEPTLKAPPMFLVSPTPARSTFRFEDGLAQRRLLPGQLELLPRPNADLLTNSVVQMWVDAQGNTFSAVLLPPRTGAKEGDQYEADQYALQVARNLRFESIETGGPGRPKTAASELTMGTMIIEWQTSPATNEPGTSRP